MTLTKANLSESTGKIEIMEPVKNLYISTNKRLLVGENYYICLFLDTNLIAYTNNFEFIDTDLYKINFFTNEVVLPFNILGHQYNKLSIMGIIFNPENSEIKHADNFTEVFFERKDNHIIHYGTNIGTMVDGVFTCSSGVHQIPLNFYDSDLKNRAFNNRDTNFCKNIYNSDNLLRCMSGYGGLAYTVDIFDKISDIIKIIDNSSTHQ